MCSPGRSPQMDIAFPLKPNVAAPVDYSKRRHQPEKDDLELNPAGEALLAYIEESARPKELAAAFPRIVNHMAKLWKIPREMNRYFEELLTDTRGRRGLRHADAAEGAVDPVHAELLERGRVRQQRVALVHRHRERAHLALVVDREGGVGHGAAHVPAGHRDGHVAGALERHVEGLDAELRVEALVRRVVRGIDPRSAERELSGLLLRGLEEILEGLDGARLGHDQRVRRVVKPVRRRDVLGLVL